MKIRYYTDASYKATQTEETLANIVLGMPEPEEMEESEREAFRTGEATPMCNFPTKDGHWKAVPWNWIIEITQ